VRHQGFDFGSGSRGAYDSEVAFVDHHVGRVLDALRKGPHWERTAVILTSDHGEAFGEHGMIRHGFELWEELVRVPLLVRVPGVAAQRIQQRRSIIDVVPTVLELMRAPLPSGEGADFMSGQSLLLELTAKSGSPAATRPVFVDMSAGPHNAERRAYIHDDLKLVTSAGRALGLYDLAADPAEKHNLMSDASRLQAAMERFKAFRRRLREVVVRPP
jgi:arylsulfatase A-like enzyme